MLVNSVTTEVLDTLRSQDGSFRKDRGRLVALIEDKVLPYFDSRLISMQVLGRYWRTASEHQQLAFTAAFRQLLTNTYAAVFEQYDRQTVETLPAQEAGSPDRVVVPTLVKRSGEQDIRVDYRLYRKDGKWQIYDVIVDGISLLINYRSEYAIALQHQKLDVLITKIEEKNAAFAAQAP